MNNFTFQIQVSHYNYQNKQEATASLSAKTAKLNNVGRMCFKKEELTIEEFLNKATNGYAFSYLFNYNPDKKYLIQTNKKYGYKSFAYPEYKRGCNRGYMKINFKRDEFFDGTQTIFVDIDETNYNSINEYVNTLPIKPTCCYTTFSNKINKAGSTSIRFRMVYVFDRVLNKVEFKSIANDLKNTIEIATKEPIYDICWLAQSQYFNGGNNVEDTYNSNVIYNADKWLENVELWSEEEIAPVNKKNNTNKTLGSKKLINDLTHLKLNQFLYKYRYTEYINDNKSNYNIDTNYFNYTDENYIQLYYNVNPIKDGNKRRKKLFYRGLQRRKINPLASADVILVNYVRDLVNFIDNSDNVITTETIIDSVNRVMRTNTQIIDAIQMEDKYKPKYVINTNLPTSTKRKLAAKARGVITFEKIGELYDTTLNVAENHKQLKEMGLNVSLATLYRFTKANNINTKVNNKNTNLIKLIDITKSIMWNMANIKDKYGIIAKYNAICNIIKEMRANDKVNKIIAA